MSELADIESAVINLVGAIQVSGSDLFAEVKGFSGTNTREVVEHLRRELKPAAYVVYGGRGQSHGHGVPDEPSISIFAITESLRGGSEPRTGSALEQGAFDVLSELFTALADSVILTDRQLSFIDERLIATDDRSVVIEHRYDVLKLAFVTAPTFDGNVICGSDSVVNVTIGDLGHETRRFAFPGIDGEFQQQLGLRSRTITWTGQLRAADDSTLNTVETTLEDLVTKALPADLIDGFGRTFASCVLQQFSRKGYRRHHPITNQALQNFELSFLQLNP